MRLVGLEPTSPPRYTLTIRRLYPSLPKGAYGKADNFTTRLPGAGFIGSHFAAARFWLPEWDLNPRRAD